MKNVVISLCLLSLSIISFSQEQKMKNDHFNVQSGLSFEAHNSKNYGMSFGGVVGQNFGDKTKPNYSAGIYFDVIFVNEPIVAPRFKVSYNYLGIFGVNLNLANHYREGLNDLRLTPEINFSLYGNMSLFLGYNIPISNYQFNEVGDFKIGINLNLIR